MNSIPSDNSHAFSLTESDDSQGNGLLHSSEADPRIEGGGNESHLSSRSSSFKSAQEGERTDEMESLLSSHTSSFKSIDSSVHASLSARAITQVPSPVERATQALATALQRDNEIADRLIHQLIRLREAKKTMACLRGINFIDPSSEVAFLATANQGKDWTTCYLILNDEKHGEVVPFVNFNSTGKKDIATIIPPIMPSGVHIVIRTAAIDKSTSIRMPNSEENRAVRRFITEAFEVYYGTDRAQELLGVFNDEAHRDEPVKVSEMNYIFAQLVNSEELSNNNAPTMSGLAVHNTENLADQPLFEQSHQSRLQETQQFFDQAHESLTESEKTLLRALWYSAETVARSNAVSVSMGVATVGGAIVGGFSGVASSLPFISVAAAPVAIYGVHGALIGTVGAGIMIAGGIGFGIFSGIHEGARYVLPYFTPGVTAQKAGTAFDQWSGRFALNTVSLMKEAQTKDRIALQELNNFFSNLPAAHSEVPDANVSQLLDAGNREEKGVVATEEKTRDVEDQVTPEDQISKVMTVREVQDILVRNIEGRMAYRAGLIQQLEKKTQKIEKANQKAVDRFQLHPGKW